MTKQIENKKMVVLVERHMALESQLAEALADLNGATQMMLDASGIKGPTESDVQRLEPLREILTSNSKQVAASRARLSSRLENETGVPFHSLSQYIATLPDADRERLEHQRMGILNRCESGQIELMQNQASLFYSYDFHRRYLSGVLQSDSEGNQYGPNGSSSEVHPGNLYKRTC